jgi:sigma-B regulation protein RsbU (phosphoserine phosphatase)
MAYLLVPDKKQTRKIPIKKETFFIGRARENDLMLPSDSLSRFHAQISHRSGSFVVQDRGSLNGVYVNGTRIGQEKKLQDGDILGFGDVHVRFCMEERESVRTAGRTPDQVQRFPVAALVDSTRYKPEKKQRYLDLLYNFSARLLKQSPSSDLGEVALELIQDVWNPDRSCLMQRDESNWQIVTQRFGKNPMLTGENIEVSSKLITELESREEALLIVNRKEDKTFKASESLQRQNVSSLICAPLWNNRKIHGFFYADLIFSDRSFSYDDLEMFAILANLMAIKWENDQLWHQSLIQQQLEQELNLAGQIQRKFFPTCPPQLEGYEFGATSIPTRKVGGDAYFWHERSDGRLVIMIADVMGKGLPSSLLMSQIQAIMKIYSEQYRTAAEIVTAVNEFIYRYSTQEKFISMVVMVIDPETGNMTFCNAGHNPPFSIDTSGNVQRYDDGGMPVGVFLDQGYSQGEATLEPGTTLVLYTDGIVEARNEQDFEFGMDQLIQSVQENSYKPASELMEMIIKKVREEWLATDQEDDWTILIMKRTGTIN